jgi:hypothetical protein
MPPSAKINAFRHHGIVVSGTYISSMAQAALGLSIVWPDRTDRGKTKTESESSPKDTSD